MRYFMRHLCHFLLTLLFLIIFFKPSASAQDLVQLGKVGEWNNNYGEFKAVDVKEFDGNTYAFCATSRGMVVFNIHYEDVGQDRTKVEVSFMSFVPLGDCTDIVIQESGGSKEDLYAYITLESKGLYIRNVTNPVFSYHVGFCDTPGDANGVTISMDYAFVADGYSGLQVIDITSKAAPVVIGTCNAIGDTNEVAISGNYAFVAANWNGLQIIDISDREKPKIVSSCTFSCSIFDAWGLAISKGGDYAFVADNWDGLKVIDVSDRGDPKIVGDYPAVPISRVAISEDGNYAFVAFWERGFQVIDISDPKNMMKVGYCSSNNAYGFAIFKDYAFVADGDGDLIVVDLRNKANPVKVGSSRFGSAYGIAISGDYAIVSNVYINFGDWDSFLQIIDISDKDGPRIIGTCVTPGLGKGVTTSKDGQYAFVADGDSGLQVIDIIDPNVPSIIGSCDTPGYAIKVAISGDYALVADYWSGLQVIDISEKENPKIVGSCCPPPNIFDAWGVATSKDENYAFVAGGDSGLQVIDIIDPNVPSIIGSCDTPGYANDVFVSGDYAFIAYGSDLESSGLQIIDISNKKEPRFVSKWEIPGFANDVYVSGDYAFVAYGSDLESRGIKIIDISDKRKPNIVGNYDTLGIANGVTISGDYAFVADGEVGLQKLTINIGPPPEGKGNLILVAGGNINYKSLSHQPINTLIRKRGTTLDFPNNRTCYWQITQALANYVFNTFQNSGYEVYDIYYFNPDPLQDTDNDGTFNQLVVDAYPTREELIKIIKQFPEDHLANDGPLYIYLLGHAMQDRFLISSNEIITAQDLKEAISEFQRNTKRQVVVIIESAASGTFIDDLKDPNINVTVITSTDDGASYIKPDFSDTDIIHYNSFTKAFIDALGPDLDPNNIPEGSPETLNTHINKILKEAFIAARDQLTLAGQPFTDQAAQMAILPENEYTSLSFWDGNNSVDHLFIDQNIPHKLTIRAEDSSDNPYYPDIIFISSDPNILDPNDPEDVEMKKDQNDGIPWYRITPKRNGRVVLKGYADPNVAPHLLLSAKLTIDISIDDPGFAAAPERMAIIMAGYSGTGDYLWESTNTIANHAYKTLRDMGYARDEIYYYNPYILQDIDENRRYDDIKGYPHKNALDPDYDPNIYYYPLDYYPLALIKEGGVKEILIFLVDHGSKDSFTINPKEKLLAKELIDYIKAISSLVDKVIFIYDACNSGSFIDKIEEDGTLSQQLIAITSTVTDQTAYFLNQGIVSFSYPFLEEWLLTHSLLDAFDYACSALPLNRQTPCITDRNIVWQWDRENIYYTDESRPAIEEVEPKRGNGRLTITAKVYSLTGIKEVWAIIEGTKEPTSNPLGKAITETNKFTLDPSSDPNSFGVEYRLDIPDPCPNETNYLINLYALDKSRRPKMASYKTAVGTPIENQTLAFIIGNPNLIEDPNNRQKVENQINRAEEILKRKGVCDGSIIKINNSNELEYLASRIEENKDRNLFIYLIGKADTRDGKPYFPLDSNDTNDITPSTLSHLPYDPNQRLLILMDSPYAKQFLSSMDTKTLPKNWAGIASTDLERIFFNFQGKTYPFFSNFFFSLVLSGATVSQAYRMAQNAVSLTRQNPEVFLPEKPLGYQTINRHLNYYLGTSGIHGEDYHLISDCTARVEGNKIKLLKLSLTVHPETDTNKSTVWAILKSSPSSIDQMTIPVDLQHDPNNSLRYIEEIPYNVPYYKALFIVEGRISDQGGKTEHKAEWEEIPIAAPEPVIKKQDEYEPDDDPIVILFDPKNEVHINAEPQRRNFFCNASEDDTDLCKTFKDDIDWVWFYAEAGKIYDIYAQDLSEYGYFIQIRLYDSNMMLHYDPNSWQYSVANNYLAFYCQKGGNYLLGLYPQGGEEYILAICNLEASDGYTDLVIQVKAPQDLCLKGKMKDNIKYVYPWFDEFIFSEDLNKWKFDRLPARNYIYLYIYEGNNCNGKLIKDIQVYLQPRHNNYNEIIIEQNKLNALTDTNSVFNPGNYSETVYYNTVKEYILRNRFFPFGDKDPNFPPAGDYDGDGIRNCDEVMVYSSYPYFPTISFPLFKGLNLFYFPSINTTPNILSNVSNNNINIINKVCYYETSTRAWQKDEHNSMRYNHFNAIDVSTPGILYLDLNKKPTIPVLWLKGFLENGDLCEGSHPCSCLNTNLFDPNCFKANASISEIFNNPNLPEIEEIIRGRGFMDGKWESGYPFFGRLMGHDKQIDPYGVYIIKNSVYH